MMSRGGGRDEMSFFFVSNSAVSGKGSLALEMGLVWHGMAWHGMELLAVAGDVG